MFSNYQIFLPRNVSWKDAWLLPSISPKDCFLEKCLVAMKHFSLKMFPLEVCLAIARRFLLGGQVSREMVIDQLSACLAFLPRNVFQKNSLCPPIVFPMDCFLIGCLASARHFSRGLLPNETFGDRQTFLLQIISQKDIWQLLGIFPIDCFSEGCLAITRCFSHGLFPEKMPSGCQAFLPKNVSRGNA